MARGDYSGWLRPDLLLMTEHVYGHPCVQNHPSLSKSIAQFQTLLNSRYLVKLALHSIKNHAIHRHALMAVFTNVRSVKGWIMVCQTVINQLRALAGQPFWRLVLIWPALASNILWF